MAIRWPPGCARVAVACPTMIQYLTGICFVVVVWLVSASAVIGWGAFAWPLVISRTMRPSDLTRLFWTGLAVLLFLLLGAHLVIRIGPAIQAVVIGIGLVGLVRHRADVGQLVGRKARSLGPVVGALFVLFCLWAAHRSTAPVTQYDSAVYHIPVIAWYVQYPAVPGLANLHGRMAFNSVASLWGALFDSGWLEGRASHFCNSVLIVAMALTAFSSLGRVLRERTLPRASSLYAVFLLPAFVELLIDRNNASPTPDVATAIFLMAAIFALLNFLRDDGQQWSGSRSTQFRLTALLLALTLLSKPSAAGFVAGAGVLLLAFAWVKARSEWRSWTGALIFPTAFLAVWMLHGVVLSGYLVYPVAATGLPLPWRAPRLLAVAEAGWITQGSRYADDTAYGVDWSWLPYLWDKLVQRYYLWGLTLEPLVLSLLLAVLIILVGVRRGARGALWMWLAAPLAIGLLFWFFTAPSYRFGFALEWSLAAVLGAVLVRMVWMWRPAMSRTLLMFLVGLSAVVPVLLHAVWSDPPRRTNSLGAIFQGLQRTLLVDPGPDHGLHPLPDPETQSFETRSGLVLQVPVAQQACWRRILLCTPHPSPSLQLRQPGNLADGFVGLATFDQLDFPVQHSSYGDYVRCVNEDQSRERTCYERLNPQMRRPH